MFCNSIIIYIFILTITNGNECCIDTVYTLKDTTLPDASLIEYQIDKCEKLDKQSISNEKLITVMANCVDSQTISLQFFSDDNCEKSVSDQLSKTNGDSFHVNINIQDSSTISDSDKQESSDTKDNDKDEETEKEESPEKEESSKEEDTPEINKIKSETEQTEYVESSNTYHADTKDNDKVEQTEKEESSEKEESLKKEDTPPEINEIKSETNQTENVKSSNIDHENESTTNKELTEVVSNQDNTKQNENESDKETPSDTPPAETRTETQVDARSDNTTNTDKPPDLKAIAHEKMLSFSLKQYKTLETEKMDLEKYGGSAQAIKEIERKMEQVKNTIDQLQKRIETKELQDGDLNGLESTVVEQIEFDHETNVKRRILVKPRILSSSDTEDNSETGENEDTEYVDKDKDVDTEVGSADSVELIVNFRCNENSNSFLYGLVIIGILLIGVNGLMFVAKKYKKNNNKRMLDINEQIEQEANNVYESNYEYKSPKVLTPKEKHRHTNNDKRNVDIQSTIDTFEQKMKGKKSPVHILYHKFWHLANPQRPKG